MGAGSRGQRLGIQGFGSGSLLDSPSDRRIPMVESSIDLDRWLVAGLPRINIKSSNIIRDELLR